MNNRSQIIQDNVFSIKKRINQAAKRAGRSAKDITLLAVTKNVAIEDMRIAIQAGINFLGENRIQEAKNKFLHIGATVSWHMIGHLQTNKARVATSIFDVIQSVDSTKVADTLDREASRLDRQIGVLIEVNIGEEMQKFGVSKQETLNLVQYASQKENLHVLGLMAMAPYVQDPELTRPFFRDMKVLFDELKVKQSKRWKILSMGMSNDFEVAIEEGSTLVRIGTGIFHTPNLRRND